MLGVVPKRFADGAHPSHPDTLFRMARGDRHTAPCAMTKWFDTNYHYLVPEIIPTQTFRPDVSALTAQLAEAQADGLINVSLVIAIHFQTAAAANDCRRE